MLDKAKILYERLPEESLLFLRWLPDSLLFGPHYSREKAAVSCDKATVSLRLYEMLSYAREHTPYGRDVIPKGFSGGEAEDVLRSLPCISSSDLAGNFAYYTSDDYSARNSYITTTGGTGRDPTPIRLANESYASEWAHVHKMWEYIGYSRRHHLKLTLRGKQLKSDRLVQYNPLHNELVVDTFRLCYDNFLPFWQEAFSRPVDFIHGYPSLVREFMEYCRYFTRRPRLKGIILASENASKQEKSALRRFFECPVISWYGQSEKLVFAYDLEGTNEFKLFTSYGYAHILDQDSRGFGEITATTFVNRALPLFNYRTGDFGRLQEKTDGFYLCELSGRWGKDFVWRDTEKRIPTSAINLHSDIQKEILFYQMHQKDYGRLHIRILCKKTSRLGPGDILDRVRTEIADKLKDFTVTAGIVPDASHIVKSVRGKMIMLVQELPCRAFGARGTGFNSQD
jgi:phenylacetate-CoA ligase